MASERSELLQGTRDMLILEAVERESIHGFGISVEIRARSREVLQAEQGSLASPAVNLVLGTA
jgi:PadR family transcriptional regulator PadR